MKARFVFFMTMLISAHGMAAPIDFTTAIATGVHFQVGSTISRDGFEITSFPIQDFLDASRPFSDAQFVPTGSTSEINESFVQDGAPDRSFSSAIANGAGVLEVGVERNTFGNGFSVAISRWYTTIKNNTDNDVHFGLDLDFAPGKVEIKRTRYPLERSRAHIFAAVDYLLRTPDGGTYSDSTGNLYKYDLLVTNEGRNGTVHRSPNIVVTDLSTSEIISYRVDSFLLDLGAVVPTIPGRGELTLYYDMYAFASNQSGENLASAFIGDPLHINQGRGIILTPTSPDAAVPEPATVLLFPAGLLGIGFALRRKRQCADLA